MRLFQPRKESGRFSKYWSRCIHNRPDYIVVGRFGRTRGVDGEIYIDPATDDPNRFLDLTEFFIVDGDKRQKIRVHSVAIIGGRPVVKVKGIRTREEAARLTGASIEIPGDKARVLPEGSFYQFELIGCRVVGVDRTEYGVIEEVLFYPANDVYRIQSDRFGETLFPAVDRFVVNVDIPGREIVIDPPVGLFRTDQPDRPTENNASD